MGFPRQENESGLLFPSPGDLSDPKIETVSTAMADELFITELPGKPFYIINGARTWSIINAAETAFKEWSSKLDFIIKFFLNIG